MKQIFKVVIIAIVSFWACDTIEGPYVETPAVELGGDTLESVILFDFTGWQCVFCPRGHEKIDLLEETFPDRVNVISVHEGGGFNEPGNIGYDFRTDLGYEIWETLGKPDNLPLGSVNSMNYSDLNDPDNWTGLFNAAYELSKSAAQAFITFEYVIGNGKINSEVKIEFNANLVGNYNACILVVENHIIAPQKHYIEGLIEEYEHNHVLRASMSNGILGDLAAINPANGTTFEKDYSINLDTEWVEKNLQLIPFIYNTQTNLILPTKIIKPLTK